MTLGFAPRKKKRRWNADPDTITYKADPDDAWKNPPERPITVRFEVDGIPYATPKDNAERLSWIISTLSRKEREEHEEVQEARALAQKGTE